MRASCQVRKTDGARCWLPETEEHIPNLADVQLDLVPDLKAVGELIEGMAKR